MEIDLQTGNLFTDEGEFLKTLSCPLNKKWNDLDGSHDKSVRPCDSCSRMVHDTAGMTDHDIVILLEKDPDTCLAISADQGNCTVLPRKFR